MDKPEAVTLMEMLVVGEYTTPAGPELDDYFLVLIDRAGLVTEMPMSQSSDIITSLEETLGSRLSFRLNNAVDLASRVAYPPVLEDARLFEFKTPSGVRATLQQILNFGWQDVEKSLHPNVLEYLERPSQGCGAV